MIKITCYGATGSIPSPSTDKFKRTKYGGNTTCYFVEAGPFKIVVDAGSGARTLGNDLFGKYKMFSPEFTGMNFIFLLTHWHFDHIQGLPFHAPVYNPKNMIHFHSFAPRQDKHGKSAIENKVLELLENQQSTPHFPVPFRELPTGKAYVAHSPMFSEKFYYTDESGHYEMNGVGDERDPSTVKITTIPLNHPDGCLGYRIDYLNNSVTFAFDNENMAYANQKLVNIAKNTDLIFMDCQYDSKQLSGMCQGFGHGQVELNIDEARLTGAKVVIGSHIDPNIDDNAIDMRLALGQDYIKKITDDYNSALQNDTEAFKTLKVPPTSFEFAVEGKVWEII